MGIGSIGGFYQNYSIDSIKKVDVASVREQDELKKQQEEMLPAQVETQDAQSDKPDTRSKTADLENISLTFNAGDTFDYIGKDSDLQLLDMESVLSDIQKDSALDQYRYFVGDAKADGFQAGLEGDGIVVMK